MEKEKLKSLIYIILPILGTVFVCWYITQSTCDVVYSDYIRLVNSYLPDVYDLKKFLVPDVLTRIPIWSGLSMWSFSDFPLHWTGCWELWDWDWRGWSLRHTANGAGWD